MVLVIDLYEPTLDYYYILVNDESVLLVDGADDDMTMTLAVAMMLMTLMIAMVIKEEWGYSLARSVFPHDMSG